MQDGAVDILSYLLVGVTKQAQKKFSACSSLKFTTEELAKKSFLDLCFQFAVRQDKNSAFDNDNNLISCKDRKFFLRKEHQLLLGKKKFVFLLSTTSLPRSS